MSANKVISYEMVKFARSSKASSRQVERSRVMIEDSKKSLASLKNSQLEIKYYVECSNDYLNGPPTSSKDTESKGVLLYFNKAANTQAANE